MPLAQTTAPVIIAGAGPTGLMLATELRRGGVDVLLLDRQADRGVDGSRAAGLQPRNLEMLDQRGIVDRFLATGSPSNLPNFGGIKLDYAQLPTRFPYGINILQAETEQLLEDVAAELGTPVRWAAEVTGMRQDADGVEVTVEGPGGTETLSACYLVGCDGGRSTVRKLMGVGFPGTDAATVNLLADVELDEPPSRPMRLERHEAGLITVFQLKPGWYRIVATQRERQAGAGDPVTFEELRASVERIAGTDFGMHSPRWLSYFTDATRQAESLRVGRVFLAGDAAHIHLPAGGQGINMGMQDAFNLGWKLAAVVRGDTPGTLLDTYHDERHAADADILKMSRAQSVLCDPDPRAADLVELMTHLVGFDDVNRYLSTIMSGLDLRYPMPGAHPLLGRRVPDADISTRGADKRVFELLRAARPVLLDMSGTADLADAAAGWADRIDIVAADCPSQAWELPGVGTIPAPAALLIRPDGHVAWASDRDPDLAALQDALGVWCGPASSRL
jgi:2-polyprenyl-6-methoxyphenol hydroxylase-like FAD-dependent oxidoreductase